MHMLYDVEFYLNFLATSVNRQELRQGFGTSHRFEDCGFGTSHRFEDCVCTTLKWVFLLLVFEN